MAKLELQLHPDAEEELFREAAWYDSRESGLGDSLVSEIFRAFELILEAPGRWPLHPYIAQPSSPPIRRMVVDRFPYSIAYQAFPQRILILAVAHAKRHPLYWHERID